MINFINVEEGGEEDLCRDSCQSSSEKDDPAMRYEDLHLRARKLSGNLKRISQESLNLKAEADNKQSEAVQAIIKRYSDILGT